MNLARNSKNIALHSKKSIFDPHFLLIIRQYNNEPNNIHMTLKPIFYDGQLKRIVKKISLKLFIYYIFFVERKKDL